MALLSTVIVSVLRDISLRALAIVALLFLALCVLSGISSHCAGTTVSSFSSVSFSLILLSFLFFFGLFFGLLGDL